MVDLSVKVGAVTLTRRALRHPSLRRGLPSQTLLQVEDRPFDADAAQLLPASTLERAHAYVTGPNRTRHDLLHRGLARNAVLARDALHELQKTIRAAGDWSALFSRINLRRTDSTFSTELVPSVSTVPTLSNRSAAKASSGLRA